MVVVAAGASVFASGPLVTGQRFSASGPTGARSISGLTHDVTAAAYLSASSVLFGNSLDFPIGLALFNLEPGVTVNAPDSFVTNNIFAPPGSVAATPVPAALPLFATGLGALGLFGWRRKKKAAALAA